MEPMKISNTS